MFPLSKPRRSLMFACWLVLGSGAAGVRGDDEGWKDLVHTGDFDAWKSPTTAWAIVGGVKLDPKNPKMLVSEPGTGVIYNGPAGRAINLLSREKFGDVQVKLEFLVPKGSNSGIKLEGVYEIQIFDSFGKKEVKGDDCGGIYPRAEFLPRYHHIDDGYAPRVNACRPPGEWQELDITFRAPRFDTSGAKVEDAQFVKVVLNGETVHEGKKVDTPTGNAWRGKETPEGPIMLQADHGPVAFRNVKVRPLNVK